MANDDRPDLHIRLTRRDFLVLAAATAAAACADDEAAAPAPDTGVDAGPDTADTADAGNPYPIIEAPPAPDAPDLPADPFALGVASGDPLADGFILWTRLAPEPLETSGGMPDVDVPVRFEVARDQAFTDLVYRGWRMATADLAHSIHADVRGLPADSWFYYRFHVGEQWTSSVGRTRTLPAADAEVPRLRVGVATCQRYTAGYYNAHRHMAADDLDLVVFVGDYIYETADTGADTDVRHHIGGRCESLEDFRRRYGLYKLDPDLQASHARFPWVATWDDHEIANGYAGLVPESAAAHQAYYEHMPIRLPSAAPPEDFTHMQIYRGFEIGDLVSLSVLDGRQYRDPQPCGGEAGQPCDEAFAEGRTMLGAEQRAWLVERLRASEARWKLVAQPVVFGPMNFDNAFINPDQWDGYQAERQALLDVFAEVGDVVVLTGDIHAGAFGTLHADDDDTTSPVVGFEIVTPSISSGGDGNDGVVLPASALVGGLDNLHYMNSLRRGWAVCEFGPHACRVTYKIVSTVLAPTAEQSVDAEFLIADGSFERTV